MKNILAIDPGTKSGATFIGDHDHFTESWNVAAVKGTKKRLAEPKYYRLMHLLDRLVTVYLDHGIDIIVCEGAQGFLRGKSAVEASHKYRGIIELFCALNKVKYVEIQPNDLKFFALGKTSGGKDEMIEAAQRLGYVGDNDNEADSYLIAKWYLSTLNTNDND